MASVAAGLQPSPSAACGGVSSRSVIAPRFFFTDKASNVPPAGGDCRRGHSPPAGEGAGGAGAGTVGGGDRWEPRLPCRARLSLLFPLGSRWKGGEVLGLAAGEASGADEGEEGGVASPDDPGGPAADGDDGQGLGDKVGIETGRMTWAAQGVELGPGAWPMVAGSRRSGGLRRWP